MPTVITRGAASAQGYGYAGVKKAANYIEDVFSTYLYTGNSTSGGTQTITNGVDLSTKGGMVWIKGRSAASNNVLFDTARGAGTTASNNQALSSNLTTAEDLGASYDFLSAFNTDGFTVTQGGTTTATRGTNYNNVTYASWTFRKQAKFFDVVTYSGSGAGTQTISHSLGATPGFIVVKRLNATTDWWAYHRSLSFGQSLRLNLSDAVTSIYEFGTVNSTSFQVIANDLCAFGGTYVAYLFAHDAGGFGASGMDNVISCGSFTLSAGNATVNLGWEPQYVLWKASSTTGSWTILDTMRGFTSEYRADLYANLSNAEATSTTPFLKLTSTGFTTNPGGFGAGNNNTYIYIAIRRGPMKTPTSGTSVFSPASQTVTAGSTINPGFPSDMTYCSYVAAYNTNYMNLFQDRLRGYATADTSGTYSVLCSNTTDTNTALSPGNPVLYGINNSQTNISFGTNAATGKTQVYAFRRAPGFFDVVCYNGNGTNRTINHNLGVTPELIIVKGRVLTSPWSVYSAALANTERLVLNTTAAKATATTVWNSTSPTASVFSLGTSTDVNDNYGSGAATYVAYLFATVAGVSKIGSYTGTGTTQQINCGFTGGARFVLIKRTDSTGDWYVWDSARGIVSGNDPYLLLNSTAAEVTNTDYIDTYSAGFEISSTAPAAINANGGSFIFLAIA